MNHADKCLTSLSLARTAAAAFAVALAPALLGCSPDSCWQLENGHTYSFVVREMNLSSFSAPPFPRCAPPLAPSVGESLEFRVTELRVDEPEGCKTATGELISQHELITTDRPLRPAPVMAAGSGQVVIDARLAIDRDGCPGTWAVRALGFTDGDDPFVAYRPGRPAVVLYRSFVPDSIYEPDNATLVAACGQGEICTDSFGVEVLK